MPRVVVGHAQRARDDERGWVETPGFTQFANAAREVAVVQLERSHPKMAGGVVRIDGNRRFELVRRGVGIVPVPIEPIPVADVRFGAARRQVQRFQCVGTAGIAVRRDGRRRIVEVRHPQLGICESRKAERALRRKLRDFPEIGQC